MNVFEKTREIAKTFFNDWIQICDPKSHWTIEDFPYKSGVDENLTNAHCWKCVTVNQCWFVDKANKRPEEFDYSEYSIAKIPLSKRGLYHPNCHDQKIKIQTPKANQIEFVIPPGKIEWLFNNKSNWLKSMGYTHNYKKLILQNIYDASKTAYSQGNYTLKNHDRYGYKVTLNIDFPGGNNKKFQIYKLKSSYIIFPNGKIKNNTLIGGDQ